MVGLYIGGLTGLNSHWWWSLGTLVPAGTSDVRLEIPLSIFAAYFAWLVCYGLFGLLVLMRMAMWVWLGTPDISELICVGSLCTDFSYLVLVWVLFDFLVYTCWCPLSPLSLVLLFIRHWFYYLSYSDDGLRINWVLIVLAFLFAILVIMLIPVPCFSALSLCLTIFFCVGLVWYMELLFCWLNLWLAFLLSFLVLLPYLLFWPLYADTALFLRLFWLWGLNLVIISVSELCPELCLCLVCFKFCAGWILDVAWMTFTWAEIWTTWLVKLPKII
jgi:hypothetical protein